MALPQDIESAKRRMQQAQAELMKYLEGQFGEPELHRKLMQEAKDSSSQFLNLIERLAPKPRV
jgi:hypothetical protein